MCELHERVLILGNFVVRLTIIPASGQTGRRKACNENVKRRAVDWNYRALEGNIPKKL